ncbi:uncharacterized protein [Chelonus insularis]|nr:uncharacterized protein LOC118064187 isoform X2 [Chelonus insularis]XP_034934505.1 uncharacterized protein LOC118064187 isoform X2 [Chelonus insularis]XP_034934506.1 uncharacterized protein LOC118064187 isoform X2 [Chelonus insularis]
MWNRKVFIRIVEVLLCIACVVALRVTDDESRRVFNYLRYRSREWSLLNNVTWGTIGAALATATCGGYVIITAGLLIAAATGELRGRKTEIFLLGLGVILFAIVGGLSLASIENVPSDLVDNAAVLGALCLITVLVFIADLLMTTPEQKQKPESAQILIDRNTVKPMTTLTIEKEPKVSKSNGNNKDKDKPNGNPDEITVKHDHKSKEKSSDSRDHGDKHATAQYPPNTDLGTLAEPIRDYDDEDIKFIDAERQTQSHSNGRYHSGGSSKFRDAETMTRDRYMHERDDGRAYYQGHEMIMRPLDEADTPRFPTSRDSMTESMFSKIVNPSVKIMRVDHDNDNFDNNGRYSDSSQYDNVPTRLAPGILKRGRDAYHAHTGRSYRIPDRTKDEIEMLEEWVGVLRKSTTGTQTPSALPSSPTDPGYVKHTANNWPRDFKYKTPGSSPNREDNR